MAPRWVEEVLDNVALQRPKRGEFRVITRLEDPPVLIEVTSVTNNDLCRVVRGRCVLTGEEVSHGLYTEAQRDRLGPPLNEMEVIAWASGTT